MKKSRTRFDQVGYAIVAVAWAAGILWGVTQGAFAMGEMVAYLAFGSGLFMCFWIALGWAARKMKRSQ